MALAEQRNSDPHQHRAYQAAENPNPRLAPPLNHGNDPAAYPKSCAGPQSREDEELCIEARSAIAAEQQAIAATKTLWIGLGGTIAVVLSLFATAWAAWAAQRSAKAAEGALEASGRPFVFVDLFSMVSVEGGGLLNVTWKNSGATPALHATNSSNWSFFPGDIPGDFDFPEFENGSWVPARTQNLPFFIGPLATKLSHPLVVEGEWLNKVADGEGKIYYWGWIEYDDPVGRKRRRTEFCAEVEVRSNKSVPDETGTYKREVVVAFPTYRRHNAVDDDCMKKPKNYI